MTAERLKILYLCADEGIPLYGTKGASAHIRQFVEAMKGAGNDVTVVTRGDGLPSDRAASFKAVFVPKSPGSNFNHGRAHSNFDFTQGEVKRIPNKLVLDSILRLGYVEKFDLVYERYSLYSNAGLTFARTAGIPFILEVNSPLIEEAAQYRRLDLPQLAGAIERDLFSSADHVIAVSTEMKGYIKSVAPGARISVVPNGVDIGRFDFLQKSNGQGKFLKLGGENEISIGFVGNVRPWHGIENLIDSFSILAKEAPNCRLVIVGDTGNSRSEFVSRCAQYSLDGVVSFTGPVPFDEIPSYLRELDIAVAPYPQLANFYFSSLKIFEYMAAGKAIVASRIGQVGEILCDEETALLVPAGDIVAFSAALKKLVRDTRLRGILGENARREAVAKHTWGSRIRDIMAVVDSLMVDRNDRLRHT
jgi:glycosyltransferase involved in cell wall biosynthesis